MQMASANQLNASKSQDWVLTGTALVAEEQLFPQSAVHWPGPSDFALMKSPGLHNLPVTRFLKNQPL